MVPRPILYCCQNLYFGMLLNHTYILTHIIGSYECKDVASPSCWLDAGEKLDLNHWNHKKADTLQDTTASKNTTGGFRQFLMHVAVQRRFYNYIYMFIYWVLVSMLLKLKSFYEFNLHTRYFIVTDIICMLNPIDWQLNIETRLMIIHSLQIYCIIRTEFSNTFITAWSKLSIGCD